jgi:hypothetical protein
MSIAVAVQADHYAGFVDNYEWLDVFIRKHRAHPEIVRGAILVQIDKYYARYGKKDDQRQEAQKALWYSAYLAAWELEGCVPICAKDVPDILRKHGHEFFKASVCV